ncbi:MAG: hypothetical protein OXI07_09485 [Gammaproteobacteria bacterium]|nr:hypothetical protein [Gammaproteobacteria bacterium]
MHSKTTRTVCGGDTLSGLEREAFERLKDELIRAFAAPDDSYRPLTASKVIASNKERPSP